MGNFYNDHGLADLNTDGIADGVYALPGDEPDEVAPLTSQRQYYHFHVRNRYPNDTVSALEDVAVPGSMTVFMDPADSAAAPVLVIEGKLTVGGF